MPWYGFTKYGVADVPNTEPSGVETGQIYMFLGPMSGMSGSAAEAETAPAGYLFCNGAEVLIAGPYQKLYDHFTLSNISFGAAALNKFRLPDNRDKTVLGSNPTAIGVTGGASAHTHVGTGSHSHDLSAAGQHQHLAVDHSHTLNAHTHTHSGHTHAAGSDLHVWETATASVPSENTNHTGWTGPFVVAFVNHTHEFSGQSGNTGLASGGPSSGSSTVSSYSATNPKYPLTTANPAQTSTTESGTATFQSIGNDNIPPYYNLNFMIKI